jgi:Asp-tRNA(Asn)/Glu-tRNA(Gln) amidotransferase C subunit
LNEQELREKDEQLQQFQLELEKLLGEFQQLQQFRSTPISLPSSELGRVSLG